MSTTAVVTADTSHAEAVSGRTNGRTKKPGWWWKRRNERLKKQRQAAEGADLQEIPSSAYIEELPEDATVTEETVAPASQKDANAGAKDTHRRRFRNKRGNNSRKNKWQKKVEDDIAVLPEPITDAVEKEAQAEEVATPGSEPEPIPGEPVQEFFAQYEGFVYRPGKKPNQEFNRLCRMMNWERGDAERTAAWRQLASAMAFQFEGRYGSDANDLGAWQKLCVRIGITPVPNELEEAKGAVFNTHVNLVDLTTLPHDVKIAIFADERELSKYTRGGGGIFPKSDAAADGTLLSSLLRRIAVPPPVGSRRDSRNRIIRPNHRDNARSVVPH